MCLDLSLSLSLHSGVKKNNSPSLLLGTAGCLNAAQVSSKVLCCCWTWETNGAARENQQEPLQQFPARQWGLEEDSWVGEDREKVGRGKPGQGEDNLGDGSGPGKGQGQQHQLPPNPIPLTGLNSWCSSK